MRPLIADVFCGSGLVYDGLYAAGWQPVGFDIVDQPNYPGPFIQVDALHIRRFRGFPALWFSPPCLSETELWTSARREEAEHGAEKEAPPELITPIQRLVDQLGVPYVIENVRSTKLLRNPLILCGSMFGLGATDGGQRYHLERHRKFEVNWPLQVPKCQHQKPVVGVYGGHARIRSASAGGRKTRDPWQGRGVDIMHEAMGVRRRYTVDALSQGIPPAYAEFIGRQLLAHVQGLKEAA